MIWKMYDDKLPPNILFDFVTSKTKLNIEDVIL